jgi:serine/threonine-protein kinase
MKMRKKLLLSLTKWGVVVLSMLILAALGAYLSLKISILGTEVVVPEILSLSVDEAGHLLSSEGLRLEITGERLDDGVGRGRILSQDPLAGSKIRRGRKVKAVLSLGAKLLKVPSVLENSERSARVKINQRGLHLGWVTYVYNDIGKTKVIAQSPSAGMEKLKGGRLNLLVSRGQKREMYAMPDLIGRDSSSIISLLESAGLRVGVFKKLGTTYQQGIIASQYPLSGYPVSEGDVVNLTVLE